MSKSRLFSIYLLKEGFDPSNALKDDHHLEDEIQATSLPDGASLFVLDNMPQTPWWKGYFGISKTLNQVTKGALIFLPVGERWFALSFGHVFHNLKDVSYEYDFGLRVTLNSLDPTKLKSTDVLDPGAGRRQRTQVPIESDLTFFDFDRDSTILKSLTGKVKDAHKELFKQATGASNLRINSAVVPDDLVALCENILELYRSEEYKTTFPDIQHVAPVRDPSLIDQLNEKLLTAFQAKDDGLNLTVPDLINYRENVYARFSGVGASFMYDDIYTGRYYEYLEQHEVDLAAVGIEGFRKHSLLLTDEEGSIRERYGIYKCLIFDTSLDGDAETYHLCEGNWYKVEQDYIIKLENYLDPLCTDIALPPYEHGSEGAYNEAVADGDQSFVCLDKTSISPTGQSQIEPCDLYSVEDGTAIFYHVKVSTLSRQLSHLFNQGTNAIELIKLEDEALEKLKSLIREKVDDNDQEGLIAPLDGQHHHVVFAIITHKDRNRKSKNLPLFSRISLNRNVKALRLMNVEVSLGFVEDNTAKTVGRKKKRKGSVNSETGASGDLELSMVSP